MDVVVICGRNRSLRRRVSRLAERTGDGRLTAQGFVGNMADWLRCADIVVGKAGPGTIAEATCCGAPLVLTSFVPGQEKGNAEFVTESGAGSTRRGRGSSRPRSVGSAATRPRSPPCATRRRGRAGPARRSTSPASSPSWRSSGPSRTGRRAGRGGRARRGVVAGDGRCGWRADSAGGWPTTSGDGWPSGSLPALRSDHRAMGVVLAGTARRSGVLIRAALERYRVGPIGLVFHR